MKTPTFLVPDEADLASVFASVPSGGAAATFPFPPLPFLLLMFLLF